MRRIVKLEPPQLLQTWKRANPNRRYQHLDNAVRQAIRTACVHEQFFLCAYCCSPVSEYDATNEHVVPQQHAPNRSVDFSNIVASCQTKGQCDSAHQAQLLHLTPLMPECEEELRFRFSGLVEGKTERARETIRILNLGESIQKNRNLVKYRKEIIRSVLVHREGLDPEMPIESDELLQILIDDLQQPRDGRLEQLAPVIVSVLKDWLSHGRL